MKDENVFKTRLFNHTMPVKEGLWDSIESRLPPQRDERRFPFFWLVLFSSALLGGILMFSRIDHPKPTNSPPANGKPFTLQNKQINTPSQTYTQPKETYPSNTIGSPSPTTNENTISGGENQQVAVPTQVHHSNTLTSQIKSGISSNKTDHEYNAIPSSASHATLRDDFIVPFLSTDIIGLQKESERVAGLTAISADPSCYKFSGSGSWSYAFSADLFLGPGFSPRSFEQTPDSESTIYADARKSTERHQYGWSAGARVNLQLRNGLAARLGIQYEQTGDIFDYMDSLAFQTSTRFDSFFASDGTFLYVDTVRVQIHGTRVKKIHNTYRHLDIPILIGYELPMGRSTIMISLGPVINLTSSHEGQILDPMLHPQSITPGSPRELKAYKTNLGLSLYFGAGALLPLTDRLSALIEPRLLYRIKPVTIDSYPLKEHRHFAGVNLGLRYHLN